MAAIRALNHNYPLVLTKKERKFVEDFEYKVANLYFLPKVLKCTVIKVAKERKEVKLYDLFGKKVEEYLRLFETCGGIQISLFLMKLLRKLMLFSGQMGLRMKLTAKKELIFLFQMAPSRYLCNQ